MSDSEKDELIDAQKQVIGILFEVVKRLQANNDLDEEYFQMISNDNKNEIRIKEISGERTICRVDERKLADVFERHDVSRQDHVSRRQP